MTAVMILTLVKGLTDVSGDIPEAASAQPDLLPYLLGVFKGSWLM